MGRIKQRLRIGFIHEKTVNALIDTGADRTTIRKDVSDEIGAVVKIKKYVFTHSNGEQEVTQVVAFEIRQGRRFSFVHAVVSAYITEQLIIGHDILQRWEAKIDMKTHKLTLTKYAGYEPPINKIVRL